MNYSDNFRARVEIGMAKTLKIMSILKAQILTNKKVTVKTLNLNCLKFYIERYCKSNFQLAKTIVWQLNISIIIISRNVRSQLGGSTVSHRAPPHISRLRPLTDMRDASHPAAWTTPHYATAGPTDVLLSTTTSDPSCSSDTNDTSCTSDTSCTNGTSMLLTASLS